MSDAQRWRLRCKYLEELVQLLLKEADISGWHIEEIRAEIEKAKRD